jgi:hypothetical protein
VDTWLNSLSLLDLLEELYMGLKILFSEGSSLTAREFLSVLGPRGHWIEVVDSNPLCICRFSR